MSNQDLLILQYYPRFQKLASAFLYFCIFFVAQHDIVYISIRYYLIGWCATINQYNLKFIMRGSGAKEHPVFILKQKELCIFSLLCLQFRGSDVIGKRSKGGASLVLGKVYFVHAWLQPNKLKVQFFLFFRQKSYFSFWNSSYPLCNLQIPKKNKFNIT